MAGDSGNGDMGDMSPVPCKGPTDCSATPSTPFCGPGGTCVACLKSTDCTLASAPVCTQNKCGGCATSGDCVRFQPTPYCNMGDGACVQCLSSDNCLSSNKACDTSTGQCSACTSNSQCTSDLCCTSGALPNGNPCSSGSCVDPASVVYVSASGKSCPVGPGSGTLLDPYCKIADGITAAATITSKTAVVLAGTYGENLVVKPMAGVTFTAFAVGIGGPVVAPSAAGPALTLDKSLGATQISVSFDGFTFKGATSATGHGISCLGSGTASATKLVLTHSTVSNNGGIGVSAATCDVTLNQDVIGPANLQGGIVLSATDYTLQNLQVAGNGTLDGAAPSSGSDAGGIKIATAAPARKNMVNLTIVANQNSTTNGTPIGVSCSGSPVFFNNVIFGNTNGLPTATELNGGCAPERSAFAAAGMAPFTTGNKNNYSTATCMMASELFTVANGLYKPKSTIGAPCTMVLQSNSSTATSLVGAGEPTFMSVNAPSSDLVGSSRANPPTIGAIEAP
jgi:hypothetical protein